MDIYWLLLARRGSTHILPLLKSMLRRQVTAEQSHPGSSKVTHRMNQWLVLNQDPTPPLQ